MILQGLFIVSCDLKENIWNNFVLAMGVICISISFNVCIVLCFFPSLNVLNK